MMFRKLLPICAILALSVNSAPAFADPTIAGLAPDWRKEAWKENADKKAYYWQDGQWFALPLGYINDPVPGDDFVRILLDRNKMREYLYEGRSYTGYAKDGSYKSGLQAAHRYPGRLTLAFYVKSLKPVPEDLLYNPDMSPDGLDTVSIVVEWAGGNAPPAPEEKTRVFETYYEELGPPKPLKEGHLAQIYGMPITYERPDRTYYIFETTKSYEVALGCYPQAYQPGCDGKIRDTATGTYIRVHFPEGIIWSDQSWLSVADPAFSFINSWRIED